MTNPVCFLSQQKQTLGTQGRGHKWRNFNCGVIFVSLNTYTGISTVHKTTQEPIGAQYGIVWMLSKVLKYGMMGRRSKKIS